jgi:hypothetical protein
MVIEELPALLRLLGTSELEFSALDGALKRGMPLPPMMLSDMGVLPLYVAASPTKTPVIRSKLPVD